MNHDLCAMAYRVVIVVLTCVVCRLYGQCRRASGCRRSPRRPSSG